MQMQGYDMEAAVPFIAQAMRKAGIRAPEAEVEAFVCRAIEADMQYMADTGVLDDSGLMGEGEYDDDDAFEALLDALTQPDWEDAKIDNAAQMLDAYMSAQQSFLECSGLAQ